MARDFALDLGTASTSVFARGHGLLIEEPTVAVIDPRRGEVFEIGNVALSLCESEPGVHELVWPVRGGAVSDPAVLHDFLSRLLRPLRGSFFERMRLVFVVPSKIGPTERRVLVEAGKRAGATSVYLLPFAMAAALGADLPVHEPVGTMVVDVGAGSTEAALLSLGTIVASETVRFGGVDVNAAIRSSLRRSARIVVTEPQAEELKLQIEAHRESATPLEASGFAISGGGSVTALLERRDLDFAFERHSEAVKEAVRAALVAAPPEIAQDVLLRGMVLVGGGARLTGLGPALSAEFQAPVYVSPRAEHVAGLGAAKCLEALDSLRDVFLAEYAGH